MQAYLSAPLFNQVQRLWNRNLTDLLSQAMTDLKVILPQEFRTGGKFNDAQHYGMLFRECLAQLSASDVVIAVLDGADADSGTAFEMGVAHAMGKPIVGVRTDYRAGAEHGVNIMCSRACRYMVREFAFQENPKVVAEAIVRRLRKIRKTLVG